MRLFATANADIEQPTNCGNFSPSGGFRRDISGRAPSPCKLPSPTSLCLSSKIQFFCGRNCSPRVEIKLSVVSTYKTCKLRIQLNVDSIEAECMERKPSLDCAPTKTSEPMGSKVTHPSSFPRNIGGVVPSLCETHGLPV